MTKDEIEKMVAANPQIDKAALEKALEAGRALTDSGVKPKGYSLRVPYQNPVRGTVRAVQSNTHRGK